MRRGQKYPNEPERTAMPPIHSKNHRCPAGAAGGKSAGGHRKKNGRSVEDTEV